MIRMNHRTGGNQTEQSIEGQRREHEDYAAAHEGAIPPYGNTWIDKKPE